jgi:C-terminal processing protease CtpA/Prc
MAMRDVAGNVGGEILSRFDVTFDYGRQRVLLVPNDAHGTPFAADRSGLWINRRGADVLVEAVMADGPAAAAGLRVGDALCEIDGEPTASITLDALRRRLREWPAGRVAMLRIARDGASFEAALQLRDLIPAG